MDLLSVVAVSMLPVPRARAAAAFKDFCNDPGSDPLQFVLAACQSRPDLSDALKRQARGRAECALDVAMRAGFQPIGALDARYPALLTTIPDPPPVLWVQGNADALSRPTVAIVGSRGASVYALEVADRLARELADRGLVVASGLARGVDSAAHRGCLHADGTTVAVLGSGLDRVYPAEHEGLARTISRDGAVVSELGPGAAPRKEHFPLRNRIISGISLAVVVVEASEKSGSLITARCALEQGRDVMAVPGSVLSGRNRGSHALLKDGAKVVESADDILEGLGWPAAGNTAQPVSKSLISDPLLSRMESGEAYRLEELMALTGMQGPKLLARLAELELKGLVCAVAGGSFARTGTSR